MKNIAIKIAAFAFFYQATFAGAFSQLEFDIQQQNKQYFDMLFYAVSLDPTLATEKIVINYINFIKPTAIEKTTDEFELHELYESEKKLFLQNTTNYNYDTSSILRVFLGTYSFENSSFPLVFSTIEATEIRRPCVKRGVRYICLDKYTPHGLPSTIKFSFNPTDIPRYISMTPEKAKLLIAPPADRRLISDIKFKKGVVIVHNEKYRPLEWEIVLSPENYSIKSTSKEILLEKN